MKALWNKLTAAIWRWRVRRSREYRIRQTRAKEKFASRRARGQITNKHAMIRSPRSGIWERTELIWALFNSSFFFPEKLLSVMVRGTLYASLFAFWNPQNKMSQQTKEREKRFEYRALPCFMLPSLYAGCRISKLNVKVNCYNNKFPLSRSRVVVALMGTNEFKLSTL